MARNREAEVIAAGIAGVLWAGFTNQEKTLVRFGMFPAEKMATAEAELRLHAGRDTVRLLAVALMDCAKADGGMRA
jgi:hypothetical protein